MFRWSRHCACALAAFGSTLAFGQDLKTTPLAEAFGGTPALYGMRLSPDGARTVHVQNLPDGTVSREQVAAFCADYERRIREAGGIDLQILGIGRTGHIGFNEPGSSLASLTRVKTLTEQTRADNARFFDSPDDVPVHCITQGIGTILRARHLVLLAFGEGKAGAIADAVEGPVSASRPGSAIQLHPHATVVVDEAAASRLERAGYYRHAWANKPDWQGM